MTATTTPTVFITGNRGQLGHDLMTVLAPTCHLDGADLPELDITDAAALRARLETARPQIIVNAAAFTRVDACETERDAAWRANVEGPRLLAAAALHLDALLVHVSTDYVFDGQRPVPQPYLETDDTAPSSYYGLTKREGEMAIAASGARHIIARTAWLYGAHGANFPKTIVRLALQNPQKPLRIVNDQFGSPTWSLSLARQIATLIAAGGSGIYHATAEGHCSWYTFARRLLEHLEIHHDIQPCTTADYPTPARRPANSILENARLKAAGINRMPDWETDLATFVQHHRAALIPPPQ